MIFRDRFHFRRAAGRDSARRYAARPNTLEECLIYDMLEQMARIFALKPQRNKIRLPGCFTVDKLISDLITSISRQRYAMMLMNIY